MTAALDGAPEELYVAALASHREGDRARSDALCHRLLERQPENADALHLLGVNAYRAGEHDQAILHLRRALERAPHNAEVHNTLGAVLFARGDVPGAALSYEAALRLNPGYAEARSNLGRTYQSRGDYPAAARCYRAALALKPGLVDAHNHLGSLLQAQGDLHAAVACYQAALKAEPNHAGALNNLGTALQAAGNLNEAIRFFEAALERSPANEVARGNLQRAYARGLPSWHFSMINDSARNDAYREALRKAVRPDSLVLDIGTGSGLLAMLAAQAGARRVVACEALPFVARKATEIVRRNGFGERIEILPKRSTAITPEEMPERADVLVTEVFDSQVLGEGVLQTLEHAHAALLKDGARIIPARARIHATLIECEPLHRMLRAREACGFDLAPFNDFARKEFTAVNVRPFAPVQLTRSQVVFDFDFSRKAFPAEEKRLGMRATRAGTCHAVLFWFELLLDDEITYSSSPFEPGTFCLHWGQCVQAFDTPPRVRGGEDVALLASHDRVRVTFALR